MTHATREGQMLSLEQANLYDRARRLSTSNLIREATKLGYDEGYNNAYKEGYNEGYSEGYAEGQDSGNLCSECQAPPDD